MSEEIKTKLVKLVAQEKGFRNVKTYSGFDASRRNNKNPVIKPIPVYEGDVFDLEVPLIPSKEDPKKLVPKIPRWTKLFKAPAKADVDAEAKAKADAEAKAKADAEAKAK